MQKFSQSIVHIDICVRRKVSLRLHLIAVSYNLCVHLSPSILHLKGISFQLCACWYWQHDPPHGGQGITWKTRDCSKNN